jgi:hypothetical protein
MIEYHAENGSAPWVIRTGKNRIWYAYPTLMAALRRYPRIWLVTRKSGL